MERQQKRQRVNESLTIRQIRMHYTIWVRLPSELRDIIRSYCDPELENFETNIYQVVNDNRNILDPWAGKLWFRRYVGDDPTLLFTIPRSRKAFGLHYHYLELLQIKMEQVKREYHPVNNHMMVLGKTLDEQEMKVSNALAIALTGHSIREVTAEEHEEHQFQSRSYMWIHDRFICLLLLGFTSNVDYNKKCKCPSRLLDTRFNALPKR